MFDKSKFAEIIKKISETYNNQRDFSSLSGINRTYLSKYMNMKLEDPPTPKILKKLAKASKGLTTYNELMFLCDYTMNFQNNSDYLQKEKIFDQYTEKLKNIGLNDNLINLLNSIYMSEPFEGKYYNIEQFFDLVPNSLKEELENIYSDLFNATFKYNEEKPGQTIEHNFKNSYQYYMCPVYGRISAGQPNWAEECIEGRIPIDIDLMNIANPEECFFLHVDGESMNKEIKNGAYALIRKTNFVENGEIAVVLVNGYDATLKKFSKQDDLIILEPMSTDPSFTTQVYSKDTEVKVIGKYIGKMEIK